MTTAYVFEEVDTSPAGFPAAFKALPREIELLKKACFEQAYYYLDQDGVLDTNGSAQIPANIRVGSIALEGLGQNIIGSSRSALAFRFVSPLLLNGGSTVWFREN